MLAKIESDPLCVELYAKQKDLSKKPRKTTPIEKEREFNVHETDEYKLLISKLDLIRNFINEQKSNKNKKIKVCMNKFLQKSCQ